MNPPNSLGTIMVVDDMRDMRNVVVDCLHQEGYATVEASNGEEALHLLTSEEKISLVVLDLSMPVMDGYHFLKAKEHLPRRRNLPVIIFSGNIGVETLIGSAGVVSAFPKDTSISLLIEAVKLSVPLFK